MDSPGKKAQLEQSLAPSPLTPLTDAEKMTADLEDGRDGIPASIWADIAKHERFIFFTLIFLDGSVLWAYYSCLSAEYFYVERFANSHYNFDFLTTIWTAWPMVVSQALQLISGTDKKFGQKPRVVLGYGLYIAMGICIMLFSAINFKDDNTGALLVLISFAVIGVGDSLSEATFFALAALFPMEKFTNAVQIGNVCGGVVNITINAVIRLLVGGIKQTRSNTTLSFYLFFSLHLVVSVVSLVLYYKLLQLPCIKFLMDRNEAATKAQNIGLHPMQNLRRMWRVLKVVWIPAACQFLVSFITLTVYPGYGCTAKRNITTYVNNPTSIAAKWYCSPGIVASYKYGDLIGRCVCTVAVYKLFTMKRTFVFAWVRVVYIPLLLMGISGTSFYVFGSHVAWSMVYNMLVNLTVGITNGLLLTVSMGTAPRLLPAEDRETAGSVVVFFTFLGIAAGAHFGYITKTNGWLGL